MCQKCRGQFATFLRLRGDHHIGPGHRQAGAAQSGDQTGAQIGLGQMRGHEGRAKASARGGQRHGSLIHAQADFGRRTKARGGKPALPAWRGGMGRSPIGVDQRGKTKAGGSDRDDLVVKQLGDLMIGVKKATIGQAQTATGKFNRVILYPQVKVSHLRESGQPRHQPMVGQRGNTGHRQPLPATARAEVPRQRRDFGKRKVQPRLDRPSGIGQGQPIALAQEKLLAEMLFQRPDLQPYCGRGDAKLAPRLGERAKPRRRLERPQRGQGWQVRHLALPQVFLGIAYNFSCCPASLLRRSLGHPKENAMQDLIDLDRYPLDKPGTPAWDALVAQCRADLARDGMFDLAGFLRPAALAQAVAELTPRSREDAFTHSRQHNIYFRKEVPGLDPDHPALKLFETVNHTLCGDQVGGIMQTLYEVPDFAAFLAACMDKPALHTMDDPLARVNVMTYRAGETLNWHFDRSEFTTTVLLQAPKAGGQFEYRTDLRSDTDPNYDGVARMLAGLDPQVRRITLTAGALNVFRGKNTAHRVTPVEGNTDRMIAVFSFYDRPGVRMTPEEQKGFYGRAA